MRRIIFLICCLGVLNISATAQNKPKTKPGLENNIQQYWFVMLLKGKNQAHDSAAAAKLMEGHLANINRLYHEGKLKVAGPFGDDGEWRGIFIFDCPTKKEVEDLLNSDPAIAAGRLAYELHPWWTAPIGSFTPGKPPEE